MRKCLILIVLLIVTQLNGIHAQALFDAPDTICVRQPIQLKPLNTNASSYYWSFCSGYMGYSKATGYNMGDTLGLNDANDIEIAQDGKKYYGFVINRATKELIRLEFGDSLSNIPKYTSLGDLDGTIIEDANSLFLMKDGAGKWVMFAVGGTSQANSALMRMDFGNSLANKPNCVNMGNLSDVLNIPRGFFAAKEGPYWYGFAVNGGDDNLIRFDFGTNISNTPNAVSLGVPSISQPTDMAAIKDAIGNWHFFVTNFGSNTVTEILMGSSLASVPTGNVLSAPDSLLGPSSIILAKECGTDYAFIANSGNGNLVKMTFTDLVSSTFTDVSLNNVGDFHAAMGLSHFIRQGDNIYAFAVNQDNSLSQVRFSNCTNSSIRSSTEKYPPVIEYDLPGKYNVYLATDEGMPNADARCFQITVLQIPAITIVDDTLICQGDTAHLFIQAFGTDTLKWEPYYNSSAYSTTVDALFTDVWPDYSRPYHAIAIYPNGCIVDSPIVVNVSKVKADAGVDRVIADGGTTILGGPMTTETDSFIYLWNPASFLSSTMMPNPVSTPFNDITYTLTVTNNRGCVDVDTVTIRVDCADINLPNAFSPDNHYSGNDHFGLLNKNIVKLNHFRIFDRWGKMVFSTTDIAEQWDGKFNGIDAPFGVYVWEADGFCVNGKRITKTGNVTLIR